MDYKEQIIKAKRLVIKLGTAVLTEENGYGVSLRQINAIIKSISELNIQGKEIIIVTSGSVGLGINKLGLNKAPDSIILKQACAAVGQGILMSIYEKGFSKYGISVAQVLLTEEAFSNRQKYLNLRNTLNTLLDKNIIPIINENDVVSDLEIKSYIKNDIKICFGDNDKLSALVMSKLDADLLIILSDIEGVYNADPKQVKAAKIIPVIEKIDKKIKTLVFSASKKGRGGMTTKLEAASIATSSGGIAIIANGKDKKVLNKIFSYRDIGTVFLPKENLSKKKRWIGYATTVSSLIKVNSGAKAALIKQNASLLPVGIIKIKNKFKKGDVVSIIDEKNKEFARGIVNYSSSECEKIIGKQSSEIVKILGHKNYDEIILKDNITIIETED